MAKKKKNKSINIIRSIIALLLFFILCYFNQFEKNQPVVQGEPPVFYSNICQDNLENLFEEAIRSAQKSIALIIYSLNDKKLITALNKKADEGILVKVIHDVTTPSYGFRKLTKKIDVQGIKTSGLMHQKILIVDGEKIWLGSANWTTESLKLHDNLVVGLVHPELAQAIADGLPFFSSQLNEQQLEFWSLPQNGKEGLERIIKLINQAKKTVKVAMFTWTHIDLTQAVIRAHQRGVKVAVLMDRGQAQGVCSRTLNLLRNAGIDVRLGGNLGMLHHKFAWIDDDLLVHGSANWTVAAFTRNHDCFLVLQPLTAAQKLKMEKMWQKTEAAAEREATIGALPLAA